MNPMDILKNMQQLQSRMTEAQDKVKEITATGTAGGDMVRIDITGEFIVTNVVSTRIFGRPGGVALSKNQHPNGLAEPVGQQSYTPYLLLGVPWVGTGTQVDFHSLIEFGARYLFHQAYGLRRFVLLLTVHQRRGLLETFSLLHN